MTGTVITPSRNEFAVSVHLELVSERELEVPLRVCPPVSGGIDNARAAGRSERTAVELADKTIRVVQIDVVEEVD